MDADEKRIKEHIATLPPFEAADKQEWEQFAAQRLALPPFLLEKGDHEVAFAERLGCQLQVMFAEKLARSEALTPKELNDAADAVDFQGRHKLAHSYALAILMEHWKYWILITSTSS